MPSRAIRKAAFFRTIPVMTGYLFLGTAFGMLLQDAGYRWPWALLASLTVYAGSMQFVLVGLLQQDAGLLLVAAATFMVNSRHVFYGLSFIDRFAAMGRKGLYMMFSLTDETYALLCSLPPDTGDHKEGRDLMFWISLMDQSYWVVGSLVGSLLGGLLAFDTAGLDFAMTALFAVIVVEQWLAGRTWQPVAVGMVPAVICLLALGPDRFLLPALCISAGILFVGNRRNASAEASEGGSA